MARTPEDLYPEPEPTTQAGVPPDGSRSVPREAPEPRLPNPRPVEPAATMDQAREIGNRGGVAVMSYGQPAPVAQDPGAEQARYSSGYYARANQPIVAPSHFNLRDSSERDAWKHREREVNMRQAATGSLMDQKQMAEQAEKREAIYEQYVAQQHALRAKEIADQQYGRRDADPRPLYDQVQGRLDNAAWLDGRPDVTLKGGPDQVFNMSDFGAPGASAARPEPSAWDPALGQPAPRVVDVVNNPRLSNLQIMQHLEKGPGTGAATAVADVWKDAYAGYRDRYVAAETPYIAAGVNSLVGPQGDEETDQAYLARQQAAVGLVRSELNKLSNGNIMGPQADDMLPPQQFAANLVVSMGMRDRSNKDIQPRRFGFNPTPDQVATGGPWVVDPNYGDDALPNRPYMNALFGPGVGPDGQPLDRREIGGQLLNWAGQKAGNLLAHTGWFDTGRGGRSAVFNAEDGELYFVDLEPETLAGLPQYSRAQFMREREAGTFDPTNLRVNQGGGAPLTPVPSPFGPVTPPGVAGRETMQVNSQPEPAPALPPGNAPVVDASAPPATSDTAPMTREQAAAQQQSDYGARIMAHNAPAEEEAAASEAPFPQGAPVAPGAPVPAEDFAAIQAKGGWEHEPYVYTSNHRGDDGETTEELWARAQAMRYRAQQQAQQQQQPGGMEWLIGPNSIYSPDQWAQV